MVHNICEVGLSAAQCLLTICNRLFWVSLMIEEIYAQLRPLDIQELIRKDRLPRSLEEVFDLALSRIEKNGRTELARKLFKWAACAKRPLSVGEICEAIVLSPQMTSLPPEAERYRRPNELTTWVANLLIVDDEDGIIEFTHHSVKVYLTLLRPEDRQTSAFQFRIDEAELEIGEICVAYLHLEELRGQVLNPRQKGPESAMSSPPPWRSTMKAFPKLIAVSAVPQKASPVAATSWARLERLIIRGKTASKDNRPRGSEVIPTQDVIHMLQETFCLLAYVSEHWIGHTKRISRNSRFYRTWLQLLSSPLFIVSRPWDPERWDSAGVRALDYATKYRHESLMELILSDAFPDNSQEIRNHSCIDALFGGRERKKWIPVFPEASKFWSQDWDYILRSLEPIFPFINRLYFFRRDTEFPLAQPRWFLESNSIAELIPRNLQRTVAILFLAEMAILAGIEDKNWDITCNTLLNFSRRYCPDERWPQHQKLFVAAAFSDDVRFLNALTFSDLMPRTLTRPCRCACEALVVAAAHGWRESLEILVGIITSLAAENPDVLKKCNDYIALAFIVSSRLGNYANVVRLFSVPGIFADIRPSLAMHVPTALIAATIGDHAEVIKLLLARGASVDAVDYQGKRAQEYSSIARVEAWLGEKETTWSSTHFAVEQIGGRDEQPGKERTMTGDSS